MSKLRSAYTGILAMLLFATGSVMANPVSTENVTAKIIAEQGVLAPGQPFWLVLQLDIREGWHTYWRNPGDSGQATSIKWTLPGTVTASAIQWPYPERHYVGPVANYGYHGTALHLIKMSLAPEWPAGQPLQIKADANWLVCEEECIPESADLEITLQTSTEAQNDPASVPVFRRARASLPKTLGTKSVYQYEPSGDDIRFEFSSEPVLSDASAIEYFPYDWGLVQAPATQQLIRDPTLISITTQKGDLTFSQSVSGVLVVTDDNNQTTAYEVSSKPGSLDITDFVSGYSSALVNTQSPQLWSAIVFALLGGVILNLMPCVFPVLFMKALNLVSYADQSRVVIRRHGYVYTAGVLTCFAMLGIVLMLVKAAGQQVGWGFQLQSPLFVSVVAVIIFVLGLSLSGFVKIGAGIMGTGSQLVNKAGYSGTFFTGVLAVVVATPCTAPFMGPAIGFALTQSVVVALTVLLALGLGLALPYLLLCLVPALFRFLPKPGPWMERLQQFLAFPMYASVAWLVWVMSQQAGPNGVLALLMVLILVAFVIWLWQSARGAGKAWIAITRVGSFAALISAVALLISSMTAQTPLGNSEAISSKQYLTGPDYQAFDAQALNRLVQEGRPVFVNMTAAWCITCLANEKVALSSAELKLFFKEQDITYLKGDWTNQDAEISRYLESFGRNSVPLYVFYPPGFGEPRVLPQILTVATVMEYLQPASVQATATTPFLITNIANRGLPTYE